MAKKYEGIYLDGKIEIRQKDGDWEYIRFNGEWRIPIFPIGNHKFIRKDFDQFSPYVLEECEDGNFKFFGFKKTKP